MKDETKEMLKLVIRTLNSITVNGRDNMDMLLGSIITLERLINEPAEGETENGG